MFAVCSNTNNFIWGTSNFRTYRINQSWTILNAPLGENGLKLFPGSTEIISLSKIRTDKFAYNKRS